MNYQRFFDNLKNDLTMRYGQPIEAVVMVHRSPETGGNGLGWAFGSKKPEAKLHGNNLLVLTPTHVRVLSLGGRSGVKPRDEVAEWDRSQVVLDIYDTDRSTWMNTTLSWYGYSVHHLRVSGPELTLELDTMAENRYMDPAAELRTMWHAIGRVAA